MVKQVLFIIKILSFVFLIFALSPFASIAQNNTFIFAVTGEVRQPDGTPAASGLTVADLRKKILEKKIIYDHGVDQREFKWNSGKTLTKIDLTNLPAYLQENSKKYTNWLE